MWRNLRGIFPYVLFSCSCSTSTAWAKMYSAKIRSFIFGSHFEVFTFNFYNLLRNLAAFVFAASQRAIRGSYYGQPLTVSIENAGFQPASFRSWLRPGLWVITNLLGIEAPSYLSPKEIIQSPSVSHPMHCSIDISSTMTFISNCNKRIITNDTSHVPLLNSSKIPSSTLLLKHLSQHFRLSSSRQLPSFAQRHEFADRPARIVRAIDDKRNRSDRKPLSEWFHDSPPRRGEVRGEKRRKREARLIRGAHNALPGWMAIVKLPLAQTCTTRSIGVKRRHYGIT